MFPGVVVNVRNKFLQGEESFKWDELVEDTASICVNKNIYTNILDEFDD